MYLKDKTSKISTHQDYHTKIVVLKNLNLYLSLPMVRKVCVQSKKEKKGGGCIGLVWGFNLSAVQLFSIRENKIIANEGGVASGMHFWGTSKLFVTMANPVCVVKKYSLVKWWIYDETMILIIDTRSYISS